jgi:diphthine-ammonia ligase
VSLWVMMMGNSPLHTLGRAAVLWTGGKDSCLALHEAILQGLRIEHLITFAPSEARFHAHPLPVQQLQARALGLPYHVLEIQEPYETAYRKGISTLRHRWGVETLVTGDIGEVDGHPNWIRQCCAGSHTGVLTPLWARGAKELLDRLVSAGFTAIVSCVREPWLTPEWLGRKLDAAAVAELSLLACRRGFDVCGEQGEYHTLVLDGPLFAQGLCFDGCQKRCEENLWYLDFRGLSLGGVQGAA